MSAPSTVRSTIRRFRKALIAGVRNGTYTTMLCGDKKAGFGIVVLRGWSAFLVSPLSKGKAGALAFNIKIGGTKIALNTKKIIPITAGVKMEEKEAEAA